jgi:ribonucleoside-triphosphate reductase
MTKTIKLSDEFVAQYADRQPDWGPLGWITYKRTYARWADKAQTRREEWYETVRRVVEGNINLDPRARTADVITELEGEAQEMFDTIYNLAWTPPGRGLWISGTDYSRKVGDALINCWYVSVRPDCYDDETSPRPSFPFVFAMDRLMVGGGVGFGSTTENVLKFPIVNNPVSLHVVCDQHHPNFRELNAVEIPQNTHTYVRVEDSREGWTHALRVVIDAHFKAKRERHVVVDVSDVRAAGAEIKGFGGTAAGPGPLIELLRAVSGILNDRVGTNLTGVDTTDMMNLIGRCVVAGNVRRSAEIALGSADDLAFISMKQNQEKLMSHRWASNNSVVIDSSFEDFDRIAAAIGVNGEPGIFNVELARTRLRLADEATDERNLAVDGTNPCGEIVLASAECCNLAEVFPAVVEHKGYDIDRVLQLALRYTKRVTCADYTWSLSARIVEQNRRVGVSLSGIRDWMVLRKVIELEQLAPELDRLYKVVREEDHVYSEAIGVVESVAVTTVKPSGTVSLLSGSSPGLHAHQSKWYIRRIRFQEHDPLVEIIKECGFLVEPDAYSPNTVVAEFPVAAPGAADRRFVTAGDLTLEEQFETQATLQRWWSDNAVSATLTFKKGERRKIPTLLREYRDQIKSTSLLPFSGEDEKTTFVQMPYESISKKRFNEISAGIKCWPHELAAQLQEEKKHEYEIVDQADCVGGACPIR